MPNLSDKLTIRQASYRLCVTPGCRTRVHGAGQHCAKCYRATPEGLLEASIHSRRRLQQLQEARRVLYNKPLPAYHCNRCVHWEGHCSLGIPEGIGTFAEDCAAFLVTTIADHPLHPIHQQAVQDRLDRAYEAAGRDKTDHPLHALYTDLFGELAAKGIQLD